MKTYKDFMATPRFKYSTRGSDSGNVVEPGPPQLEERRLKNRDSCQYKQAA